ncbi:MAG: hypothetical protein HYY93_16765 [Planctomycetes bacterium]|nr:hypothetical protein [Planctomycetota bacterium]
MTVLNASDPAMIGRTFTGSFTVTGGVPDYLGEGTFNGLPATISGDGSIDLSDGTTIVLSDHIATTDSTTTFTATLVSGDFGTGTFQGGTVDDLQTWSGVFKIAITRTPTQPPEEQIRSASETAAQNMTDTATVASAGIRSTAEAALAEMQEAPTVREVREIARRAEAAMSAIVRASFHTIEDEMRRFRSVADGIVSSASKGDQRTLRRVAGSLTGQIGTRAGEAKRRVMDASQDGRMLFQDVRAGRGKKKPLVEIRDNGMSIYEYPSAIGETKFKLGDTTYGGRIVHAFEVVWPTGPGYKIEQWIKRTMTTTYQDPEKEPSVDKKPEEDKSRGVVGGREGDEYVPDVSDDGSTLQSTSTSHDDGKTSSMDTPGPKPARGALRVEYIADFKVILKDNEDKVLECWTFTVTIVIELKKNTTDRYEATKSTLTNLQECG